MYVPSLILSDNERRNTMTIYRVICNNGEPYEDNCEWDERAFKTRESADAYVSKKNAELQTELTRAAELRFLAEQRELTDDEKNELYDLEYFSWRNRSYRIKECELYD